MTDSQIQIPFDGKPTKQPAAKPQRKDNNGKPPDTIFIPIALGTTGIIITAVSLAIADNADANSFNAMLAAYIGFIVITLAALTGFIIAIRHHAKAWASILLALATIIFGSAGIKGVIDWTLDSQTGVQDATATVESLDPTYDDDDRLNGYKLTVLMPDNTEKEWDLDVGLGENWNAKPGDKVDVTYYPRTGVITALNHD